MYIQCWPLGHIEDVPTASFIRDCVSVFSCHVARCRYLTALLWPNVSQRARLKKRWFVVTMKHHFITETLIEGSTRTGCLCLRPPLKNILSPQLALISSPKDEKYVWVRNSNVPECIYKWKKDTPPTIIWTSCFSLDPVSMCMISWGASHQYLDVWHFQDSLRRHLNVSSLKVE